MLQQPLCKQLALEAIPELGKTKLQVLHSAPSEHIWVDGWPGMHREHRCTTVKGC